MELSSSDHSTPRLSADKIMAAIGSTPRSTVDTGRSAIWVGTGILLSRIAGLIRDRVFGHYFGTSAAADAFRAAFRIPNFLQNLFGEGVLSASFVPVYAGLLARDRETEANEVAGIVAALLSLLMSVLVLIGIVLSPVLIDLIAPGFEGSKRDLTISLVRIFFPGAGILVLSAWCLGILNSHRRFFLSYVAPVIWNAAIIAALLGFGGIREESNLVKIAAWGSVGGSVLQLGVQLPVVLRLIGTIRLSLNYRLSEVRQVIKNFVPVFFSRGVVQISAYVDSMIASLLPTGAVAGLGYAQTLYLLPISLFGMSVSAAELPALSSALGSAEEIAAGLRTRLDAGLRRIAFFIVPSTVAFAALGDVVVAAIYQSGRFKQADVAYVWAILAAAAIGLPASTLGRLYASVYYAQRDTRTPLRFSLLRVTTATILGYLAAVHLPGLIGIDKRWGIVGLTLASALAAMLEYTLLRRTLIRRIGCIALPVPLLVRLWASAVLAGVVAWMIRHFVMTLHPIAVAVVVLGAYGLCYVAVTSALGVPEATALTDRLRSRRRGITGRP
jgi:putative peptidoglycan lipid II flippase